MVPRPHFDVTHAIITNLMAALQHRFKQETHYSRPLMPPQANILFVLDAEMANVMSEYISTKLTTLGGFEKSEFRFIRKSGMENGGLQRLRLEFREGVTTEVIQRIEELTDTLGEEDKSSASSS